MTSSDVLEDLRVNVMEENSDKVVWFKERFLEDDEIIEHLVHHESRRICWTMHRPRNGWYIRIRAPSFPPGAFIPLIPPLPNTHHPTGALLFSSRTNIIPINSDGGAALSPRTSTTEHSYPPTPPATSPVVPPTPTPASVQARLLEQRRAPPNAQVVTQFVLAPYTGTPEVVKPEELGFFQRALRAIKSTTAGPSYSFTLARVAPVLAPPALSPLVAESTVALTAPTPPTPSTPVPTSPPVPPLLSFIDRTPLTTVHAVTGLIELDTAQEQALGVEGSFWVAVALTYLEFLQEKESYLAALSD
ncbi:hypothetical protein B0H16DRAFT_1561224 [Mycena metata]|uniref:Uncharacterized protein n=1 Tax=Mycena metata TaxID=1033252 RepID=A0AAD7N2M0_9AGAR|nr:hypothetical protein B0H16DRAFT_1561224 [Mycena metata]